MSSLRDLVIFSELFAIHGFAPMVKDISSLWDLVVFWALSNPWIRTHGSRIFVPTGLLYFTFIHGQMSVDLVFLLLLGNQVKRDIDVYFSFRAVKRSIKLLINTGWMRYVVPTGLSYFSELFAIHGFTPMVKDISSLWDLVIFLGAF